MGQALSQRQHVVQLNPMGIPHMSNRGAQAQVSSDDDEESMHRGTSAKPDPYTTKELCRTLIGTPYWDGKGLTWKSFMKEWKAYWEFQRGLVGPKAKKWIFIKSLPDKWRSHMKAYITDADWSYKEIVEFLNQQNDIMVPDWKKESLWRQYLPRRNNYMYYMHWWITWQILQSECKLREFEWIHQLNVCMNHRRYFSKYLD